MRACAHTHTSAGKKRGKPQMLIRKKVKEKNWNGGGIINQPICLPKSGAIIQSDVNKLAELHSSVHTWNLMAFGLPFPIPRYRPRDFANQLNIVIHDNQLGMIAGIHTETYAKKHITWDAKICLKGWKVSISCTGRTDFPLKIIQMSNHEEKK